ncbi:hypothetical protein GDO81_025847 [Engystomops pustulosus]|uniref:Uncharacterized protein n=1 Tax=Engystomops pustulosus TaxID=76066 RepID=A0AAV6YI87_ENGPU|nr:hypothetical protein GDO81_025847 [Engystomops pustulosus]
MITSCSWYWSFTYIVAVNPYISAPYYEDHRVSPLSQSGPLYTTYVHIGSGVLIVRTGGDPHVSGRSEDPQYTQIKYYTPLHCQERDYYPQRLITTIQL